MARLALLMAATLVAIYAALAVLGAGDPRAARRQVAASAPEGAARDAGAARLPAPSAPERASASDPEPASPSPEAAAPVVVPAASQTPAQVQRFPGPALRPSPEHAGEAPPAAVNPTPAGSGGTVLYVTGSRVNMRAGPSTGEPVVGALNGGAAVEALGPTDGSWVNIRDGQGREGYVSGQFLSQRQPG